mmetsp:Transcript_9270/g.27949  ORF Transcript_9270/g.27949 Transcript_9270/m.27949 type:complete len:244 (-) Transcript_9270:160-891(-)
MSAMNPSDVVSMPLDPETTGTPGGTCSRMPMRNSRLYWHGTAWTTYVASERAVAGSDVALIDVGRGMSGMYRGWRWLAFSSDATSSPLTRSVTGMPLFPRTDARARPKFPPPSTATRTGYGGGSIATFIESDDERRDDAVVVVGRRHEEWVSRRFEKLRGTFRRSQKPLPPSPPANADPTRPPRCAEVDVNAPTDAIVRQYAATAKANLRTVNFRLLFPTADIVSLILSTMNKWRYRSNDWLC